MCSQAGAPAQRWTAVCMNECINLFAGQQVDDEPTRCVQQAKLESQPCGMACKERCRATRTSRAAAARPCHNTACLLITLGPCFRQLQRAGHQAYSGRSSAEQGARLPNPRRFRASKPLGRCGPQQQVHDWPGRHPAEAGRAPEHWNRSWCSQEFSDPQPTAFQLLQPWTKLTKSARHPASPPPPAPPPPWPPPQTAPPTCSSTAPSLSGLLHRACHRCRAHRLTSAWLRMATGPWWTAS